VKNLVIENEEVRKILHLKARFAELPYFCGKLLT